MSDDQNPSPQDLGARLTGEQQAEVVRILWETEPTPVASDYATLAARQNGLFVIAHCSISPEAPTKNAEGKMEAKARIVASIRMDASSFLGLLGAMAGVWNKFASQNFGAGSPVFEMKRLPPEKENAGEP